MRGKRARLLRKISGFVPNAEEKRVYHVVKHQKLIATPEEAKNIKSGKKKPNKLTNPVFYAAQIVCTGARAAYQKMKGAVYGRS